MEIEFQPFFISAALLTAAGAVTLKLVRRIERAQTEPEAFRSIVAGFVVVALTVTGVTASQKLLPMTVTIGTPEVVATTGDRDPIPPPAREAEPVVPEPPAAEPKRKARKLDIPASAARDEDGRYCVMDLQENIGLVLTQNHDPTEYLDNPERYVVGVHPIRFRGKRLHAAASDTHLDAFFFIEPDGLGADHYLQRIIDAFSQ
eukprot:g19214.t1